MTHVGAQARHARGAGKRGESCDIGRASRKGGKKPRCKGQMLDKNRITWKRTSVGGRPTVSPPGKGGKEGKGKSRATIRGRVERPLG